MKFFLLSLALFHSTVYLALAQAPQGIPYQAVARTAQGDPVVNAPLQVRFSLREQAASGAVCYQEWHALTTNDLGLFATAFGTGTASVGTFSGINWAQTVKFLQVEIDLGQGWVDMGTQQLMSVPYALYAANVSTNTNSVPVVTGVSTGGYAVSGVGLPGFLNNYGNGALGNKICVQGELLNNQSNFANLTVPEGVTVNIQPSVTTILYVKDTLFLQGTIAGIGQTGQAFMPSSATNHAGATGSGGHFQYATLIAQATSFNLSWTPADQPYTLNTFGGNITVTGGFTGPDNGYCYEATSGNNLEFSQILNEIHFGCDISGGNGGIIQPQYSSVLGAGQGGGGLYIIAKNVVFTGQINLSGGNGISYTHPLYSNIFAHTGGGGGGSCVIRTLNGIQTSGSFISQGGVKNNNCNGPIKGGNGIQLFLY